MLQRPRGDTVVDEESSDLAPHLSPAMSAGDHEAILSYTSSPNQLFKELPLETKFRGQL